MLHGAITKCPRLRKAPMAGMRSFELYAVTVALHVQPCYDAVAKRNLEYD